MRDDDPVVVGVLTVRPAGHVLDLRSGETLIEAAWRQGYDWPTLCYGMGTCTACQCEVIDGLDRVSAKTEAEIAMLGDLSRRRRRVDQRRVRLACQVRASGDLSVRKPGVTAGRDRTA